ncbi:MAG: alpha/beta fold hydrolase [Solirubrobacterales bacterium]
MPERGREAIHHTRGGEGEPLLLLHGLGATGAIWEPVVGRLSREREVIAVDLPGFGRSPALPGERTPSPVNLAAAMHEFCARIGVTRPHLAGNSLGGWIALEMAKSGQAASVTTISPAGMWGRPLGPRARDIHRLARALRPALSLALRWRRPRNAMLGVTMVRPEHVPAGTGRTLILSWVDSEAYEAANREMRTEVFDPGGFPEVPVTLAWAEHDRLVAPPRRAQFPPGARYLVLPGVGHTPTWDDPGLIARVLLEGSSRTRDVAPPLGSRFTDVGPLSGDGQGLEVPPPGRAEEETR